MKQLSDKQLLKACGEQLLNWGRLYDTLQREMEAAGVGMTRPKIVETDRKTGKVVGEVDFVKVNVKFLNAHYTRLGLGKKGKKK